MFKQRLKNTCSTGPLGGLRILQISTFSFYISVSRGDSKHGKVRQIKPAQLAFGCAINIILLTYLLIQHWYEVLLPSTGVGRTCMHHAITLRQLIRLMSSVLLLLRATRGRSQHGDRGSSGERHWRGRWCCWQATNAGHHWNEHWTSPS